MNCSERWHGLFYHRVTVHRKNLIKSVFSVQPDNFYYVLENRLLKKTFLMFTPSPFLLWSMVWGPTCMQQWYISQITSARRHWEDRPLLPNKRNINYHFGGWTVIQYYQDESHPIIQLYAYLGYFMYCLNAVYLVQVHWKSAMLCMDIVDVRGM